MSFIQIVATKVAELGKLTAGFSMQAASSLVGSAMEKAGNLSVDEVTKRFEGALRALKGQGAPATSALPGASQHVLTNEFQVYTELTHGKLEVRQGTYGTYECRLTLKEVQPGETQERVEALVDEMNGRFSLLPNCPINWKVYLSGNNDLPSVDKAGNLVVTFTPLVADSTGRHRSQAVTVGNEKRESQKGLLATQGLPEVKNDFVRVAVGMFRLAKGFPDNMDDVGTERDKGDLLEGKVVRTESGSSSGSAGSFQRGVYVLNWHGYDRARADVGVAGGASPAPKNADR
jgi:hypothetical protein